MLIKSELLTIEEQEELSQNYRKGDLRKMYNRLNTPVVYSISTETEGEKRRTYYYITGARETELGLVLYGVDEELIPISFPLAEFELKETGIEIRDYRGFLLRDIYRLQSYIYRQSKRIGEEEFYNLYISRKKRDGGLTDSEMIETEITYYLRNNDTTTLEERERETGIIRSFFRWLTEEDREIHNLDIYNEGRDYYKHLIEVRGEELACMEFEVIYLLLKQREQKRAQERPYRGHTLTHYRNPQKCDFSQLIARERKKIPNPLQEIKKSLRDKLLSEYIAESPEKDRKYLEELLRAYYDWQTSREDKSPLFYLEEVRRKSKRGEKEVQELLSYFVWLEKNREPYRI